MTRLSALLVLAGCPGGSAGTEDTAAVECDTAVVRYVDADGDGYGATPVVGCEAAVESGEDCDDADAAVHPFAGDRCGDGIDQDCTGGDRVCGEYAVGDAVVVLNLVIDPTSGCGDQNRAVAADASSPGSRSVVLSCGYDGIWSIPLAAGSHSLSSADAKFLQTDGVGRYVVWGSFDVRNTVAGAQFFAEYSKGPEVEGVRRYDPPLMGDRLDTDPGAVWEASGVGGVRTTTEIAGDGSDRILVQQTESGERLNLFVAPDAPSGDLRALASASVAGGRMFPAGDLDGDGIADLTWYDHTTDYYVGMTSGPVHDGDYVLGDFAARSWASFYPLIPVGDVDGDGSADIAVSFEREADHDNLVERRVYLLAGTAASGAVEDAAWLTVASDDCGEIRHNEDSTSWHCDVGLTPVEGGDLDGDGSSELVLHGVYASGETNDSQAAVLLDVPAGTLELDASTPGVVWLDAGAQAHWLPGYADVESAPQGGFVTDFDADGVMDLFLFSATDYNSGAAATSYLYGFRGPIE